MSNANPLVIWEKADSSLVRGCYGFNQDPLMIFFNYVLEFFAFRSMSE